MPCSTNRSALAATPSSAGQRRPAAKTMPSQVMMKVSIVPTTSPPQLGQVAKHLPHTFAPFVAELGEIGIPLIESPPPLHFEAVPFVADQVDRHTDRQIAAHGRIER